VRIAKLSLLAFGPFTHGELGFSPKPGVLDLVYGPNEAGKSTSLRALTALLYGIPPRTQDAHLHDMPRLRVGATLLDHTGRSFSFIRRKGQKQTLLDGNEDPVGEEVLSGLLGSLDANMFKHMFGLDHERLRAGAEALLVGGGNLGESLFDAGSGARAIRTVLEALKLEADELFKPRGPTTKLQVAVRALSASQKARKEAMLSPQAFGEQRKALSEARKELEAHLARRQVLLREKSRLSRALSALPLLSRRERLLTERATLGTPPVLEETDREARSSLESRLSSEERECARLTAELAQLQQALGALEEPARVVLDHELVRELEQRFGSYRKAQLERPRLEAELRAVQADIALLRERVGGAAGALERLDTPARTRLRKRAEEERALAREQRELADSLARGEHVLAEREQARLSLGAEPDLTVLERAIERAERDERALLYPQKESEQRAQELALERSLAQLGTSLSRASLATLELPSDAELDEGERTLNALEQSMERVHGELKKLAQEERALAAERALLFADGEVLTEAHLGQARDRREQAWSELVSRLEANAPEREHVLRAFRECERVADELSDRLRREASRTHALLRIELDQRALVDRRVELERERERFFTAHRAAEQLAARLLAPLGLKAYTGARARLQKLELLRERALEQAVANASLHELLEQVRTHCAELSVASGGKPEATLSAALFAAKAELRTRERLSVQQREANARLSDAQSEVRELRRKLERVEAQRAHFLEVLSRELAALGFASDLSADEALAAADELTQLKSKQREAQATKHTLERLDAETRAFAAELSSLCTAHVPEASGLSVPESLALFVKAQRRAHEALRERERALERMRKLSTELKHREHALAELLRERARVFSRAGVDSFSGLREVELRAKRVLELDTARAQLDEQLATLSEGLTIAQLEQEARVIDPDEGRARLVAIEAELEALGDDIDARNQEIGGLSAGLEQLRRESGAVSLAEETESQLANVRALARRYAEVRLGYALLSREVERYRAAHQGPVLQRASALFPKLTLGRYQRLEVALGEQDEPTLVCVRADGKNVRVEGLSDGTRDQLYLALRIASIERYLDHNPPVPLLLDDAFVHFDDGRSQAALSVLGELAQRTQVIFFTHHARMLELAKKALGNNKVLVHELDPVQGVVRTRDNGPLFARV
jgi:uncharacterized protein YhaN